MGADMGRDRTFAVDSGWMLRHAWGMGDGVATRIFCFFFFLRKFFLFSHRYHYFFFFFFFFALLSAHVSVTRQCVVVIYMCTDIQIRFLKAKCPS